MKRILVASDLSERSKYAVERALMIAQATGAEAHVVAVVDEDLPEQAAGALAAQYRTHLEGLLEGAPARASIEIATGDPVEHILIRADEMEADLVVLGLHRRRRILDMLRETTLERLVRLGRRPALLVAHPPGGAYGRVLSLVGFSGACAAALRIAADIAPGATIEAVHAMHVPFRELPGGDGAAMGRAVRRETEAQAKLWAEATGAGEAFGLPEVIEGSVSQVLDRMLAERDPDLIALGAHTRPDFAPFTLGGFTAELVRDPPRDLLITRRISAG